MCYDLEGFLTTNLYSVCQYLDLTTIIIASTPITSGKGPQRQCIELPAPANLGKLLHIKKCHTIPQTHSEWPSAVTATQISWSHNTCAPHQHSGSLFAQKWKTCACSLHLASCQVTDGCTERAVHVYTACAETQLPL